MIEKRMIYDHPFDPKSDDPTECKECYDPEDMHESSVKCDDDECEFEQRHPHDELFDLSFSFDSMCCKKCRMKFKVPDWFRVFARASQVRIEAIEDHVEKIVEGLIAIDVIPCEKCGTFFQSQTAHGLDANDITVCVSCLPEWFDSEVETADEPEIRVAENAIVSWYLQRRDAVRDADSRSALWITKTFPDLINQRIAAN